MSKLSGKYPLIQNINMSLLLIMSEEMKGPDLKIFEGINKKQRAFLNSFLKIRCFENHQIIFRQNETAANLYILIDGIVTIRFKPYDGNEMVIARILPGNMFGWSAALGRETYTSAAQCECAVKVYAISKESLKKINSLHHETGIIFLENLTGLIAERLNTPSNQIFSAISKALFADREEFKYD